PSSRDGGRCHVSNHVSEKEDVRGDVPTRAGAIRGPRLPRVNPTVPSANKLFAATAENEMTDQNRNQQNQGGRKGERDRSSQGQGSQGQGQSGKDRSEDQGMHSRSRQGEDIERDDSDESV